MTTTFVEAEMAMPGKATRREWIGLAVIALPCLLYSMDLTVLNLAVPTLSAELRPSSAQLLWIIDIYGFMVAGFLITMGNLGDRIGRRRLLMIGAAAFGAASVLAAFANSAALLIVARAVLGVAGATLAPSTLSLIRNMFHDETERTTAIGVWIASYSVGGAVGPLVGGVLLEHFSWGSVFLAAVPVMVLLLVLAPVLLPEFRAEHAGRIDLASSLLSLAAVLAFIYGVKRIAENGLAWLPAASAALGVALGALFMRRQTQLADPMLDLSLFRSREFSAALGTYALGGFVMLGVLIPVGQYLQLVLALSPLDAGWATAPWAVAFVVGSLVVPRLAQKLDPIRLMVGGLAVAALGFAVLALAGQSSGLPVVIGGLVVVSLGMAPMVTLGTDIIVGRASPERAGAASALSETSAELSGALGIALFGSLGVAIYRGSLAGALEQVPDGAATTLGAALALAESLPADARAALVDAARAAFMDSMRVTVLVSAVLTALCALLVGRALLRSAA